MWSTNRQSFFSSAKAELKENDGRTKVAYNVHSRIKLEGKMALFWQLSWMVSF